jgi:CubicO group peptidase (beta-lactamase class C family)
MDPDELGWTEEALGRLSEDVGGDGCVVRSGYLVGCWGDPEREHDWGSAGKPLQTTLLFHAMAGGFVESLQIPISIFEWGVEGADTAITLTHLANMTSGYGRLEEPGGAFAYNDVAIGLYGETLERIFKADLDAVARRLFLPLHLTDRTLLESRGGFGLQSSVADAARIGLLWLHRGQWNGTEVIPRFLFDAHLRAYLPEDHPLSRAPATDYLDVGTFGGGTHQVDFGPGVYGFTWWFNLPYPAASREVAWPEVPPDLFMAVGHWGREMILMVPSWDLVVAWVSDREWPKEGMEPGRPDSRLGRIFGHLAGLQRDPGG